MRAWNLVVMKPELVREIQAGTRNCLRFNIRAVSAKRIHIGDTVQIHSYFGQHLVVEKVVSNKTKELATVPGQDKQSPVICIWFGK